MNSLRCQEIGKSFAWAAWARICRRENFVILVGGGYGAFLFRGTRREAEEMRVHKANWEGAVARLRFAAPGEGTLSSVSHCWNHPLFNNRGRYADCRCGNCK